MKFIIEVETDDSNTIINAVARGAIVGKDKVLEKATVLNADNWLVFSDGKKMIVLSQITF